jgi:hypothetical protein
MPARNAGTSITATSTPERSRSALAFRTTRTRGSGSHPGEHESGTAATFDEARADFEQAWQVFLSKRTEADFRAWRDQRDWTARKYALWDAGKKLEPPSYGPGKPCSRFIKCPCATSRGSIDARPSHHCRSGASSMKFKEDRPFATPEAAERKLLELANAIEADHAGRLSVEIINRQFREAGGSYEEYGAAVKAAVAHGWLTLHPSGAYLSFTQAGADLFA